MYSRPTVRRQTFRNSNGTLYELRFDLHNRRVTSRVRTSRQRTGRTIVRTFPTRDDAREYVETVQDRRENLGYVRVR